MKRVEEILLLEVCPNRKEHGIHGTIRIITDENTVDD